MKHFILIVWLIGNKLLCQDYSIDSFICKNYYIDAELLAINEIATTDNHTYKDSIDVPVYLTNKYLHILSSIYLNTNMESLYVDSIFHNYKIHVLDKEQSLEFEVDNKVSWIKNLMQGSIISGNNIVDSLFEKYSLYITNKMELGETSYFWIHSTRNLNYIPLIEIFTPLHGVNNIKLDEQSVVNLPTGCDDNLPDDINLYLNNNNLNLQFIKTMGACPNYCFSRKYWVFDISDEFNIKYIKSYCDNITSKEKKEFQRLNIYPNPCRNILNTENPGMLYGTLFIYNTMGQVMFQKTLQGTEKQEVELSHLPKGMYIVKVANGQKSYSEIVLKE